MDATILSFRRGRHAQKTNQFLLAIEGCDSRQKAAGFVGRKLVWKSLPRRPGTSPKEISGKITQVHGNKGVLRARFSRGLPGEALRMQVKVLDKK